MNCGEVQLQPLKSGSSLPRSFRAVAPQGAQNLSASCLSSFCRGVGPCPTPPLAHRSHVVLCPTTFLSGAYFSSLCPVLLAMPLTLTLSQYLNSRFDNKLMRSCLASRRSVSGWGHVTHGARALLPNELGSSGFRGRRRTYQIVATLPPPPSPS